ncbi:MAG: SDR family oxidoreductase [Chitinivibrionales bacterium]|nr:SDR family oxidoreductase [Chitinivibrionales bacterium]
MARPTALVTGGAQGIGRGIVRQLLAGGWNVVSGDIDTEAGEDLVDELHTPDTLAYEPLDVSDEPSVAACVRAVVDRFGGLHGLVCNAGIGGPFGTPVEKLSLDDWHRVIGTNLTGCFLCAKHAMPHLRQSPGAAIVTIASTRALQSEPNTEAYSATKGGIVALTHALAISCGPEVRVNCISPGWIETAAHKKRSSRTTPAHTDEDRMQHPVGRVGVPEDIASLTEYLLSERAGFVTGQNFVVDGGMTRRMIYV